MKKSPYLQAVPFPPQIFYNEPVVEKKKKKLKKKKRKNVEYETDQPQMAWID